MLARPVRSCSGRASAARRGMATNAPGAPKDKVLFTPGPLSTSHTVKAAMQRDLGSRDIEFINAIKGVRSETLRQLGLDQERWTMIPMQGSGTFGVEAAISSIVPGPEAGGLLLVTNGAYGDRMGDMARVHGIHLKVLSFGDCEAPDAAAVDAALKEDPRLTHVATVHSETTSGILNDVTAIGKVVKANGRRYIIDAMSSLFGVPLDAEAAGADVLVTSSNKCVEGVPGFAVVLATREVLAESEGTARTLSLDLHGQLKGLEKSLQFRFTPPTHVVLAYQQALKELAEEGGVEARYSRYRANQKLLADGMAELGFKQYVPEALQGPIIQTYLYPDHPKWDFEEFYTRLSDMDCVLYPGKITHGEAFRVGTIGHLFPEDIELLLSNVRKVGKEMGFLE